MSEYREELDEIKKNADEFYRHYSRKRCTMRYTGSDSFKARMKYENKIKTDPYEKKLVLNSNRINHHDIINRHDLISYLLNDKKKKYIHIRYIPEKNRNIIERFISGNNEMFYVDNQLEMFFDESFYHFLENIKYNKQFSNFRKFYRKVLQYKKSYFDVLNFKPAKTNNFYILMNGIYQLFKKVHISLDTRTNVDKWKYNFIHSNQLDDFKQIQDFDQINSYLEDLLKEVFLDDGSLTFLQ